MTFKETWISSKAHFIRFEKIYKIHSSLEKLSGCFQLPIDFPHRTNRSIIMPLFYEAISAMTINAKQISFAPNPVAVSVFSRNVDTDFNLKINFIQVRSIEIYQYPDISMSLFNNSQWIKIIYVDQLDQEQEILCCDSGSTSSGRNARTKGMLRILKKYHSPLE